VEGGQEEEGVDFVLQVHYGGVWVGVIHFILVKIN